MTAEGHKIGVLIVEAQENLPFRRRQCRRYRAEHRVGTTKGVSAGATPEILPWQRCDPGTDGISLNITECA